MKTGTYLTDQQFTGVWFSDKPLDVNEGIEGYTLLIVSLRATDKALEDYEWIEEDKVHREWLIPARLINSKLIRIQVSKGI